jgi:hypothetical protein
MDSTDLQVDWIEPVRATPTGASVTIPVLETHVREQRRPLRLPVRFTTALFGELIGDAVDISPNGIGVETPQTLPVRTRAQVVVVLPSGATASMEGVVQWSRKGSPGQMGLRFERLHPALVPFLGGAGRRIAPGVFVPLRDNATEAQREKQPRLARTRCELAVRFGNTRQLLQKGTLFDVAPLGVGLKAENIPPKGSDIRLEIMLPRGTIARVEGRVVWVARSGPVVSRLATAGIFAECADEKFFRYVLDRQRAVAGGAPNEGPPAGDRAR